MDKKLEYTLEQLKKQVFLLSKKFIEEGLTNEETEEYNRLLEILDEKED